MDKIEDLFDNIYSKPDNLDHNIMSNIYRAVKEERKAHRADTFLWVSTISLCSLLFIAGVIYVFSHQLATYNHLYLVIGFAILIPVAIDKIWAYYR